MSLEGVGHDGRSFAGVGGADGRRGEPRVGQVLRVHVLQRTGEREYRAELGGQERLVQSASRLEPGTTVQAMVVEVGERLTLRRVERGPDPVEPVARLRARDTLAGMLAPGSAVEPLTRLAERFRIDLSDADGRAIARLAQDSAEPGAGAMAGLFLHKLGLPLDARAVEQIAAALARDGRSAEAFADGSLTAVDLDAVGAAEDVPRIASALAGLAAPIIAAALGEAMTGRSEAAAGVERPVAGSVGGGVMPVGPRDQAHVTLAAMAASSAGAAAVAAVPSAPWASMGDVVMSDGDEQTRSVDPATAEQPQAGPSGALTGDAIAAPGEAGDRDAREGQGDAARWLNEPDGGELTYRYARVPLLVDGELVELDMAFFRPRQPAPGKPAVQRLVVSMATRQFGDLQIVVQAVGERLDIGFSGERLQVPEVLGARVGEVHAIAGDLGWQLDAVRYEIQPAQVRAAQHIVEHVLSMDSVDHSW
jgi:hypothetical protein